MPSKKVVAFPGKDSVLTIDSVSPESKEIIHTIEDEMKDMTNFAVTMSEKIDDVLLDLAEQYQRDNKKSIDISVPLEALSGIVINMSQVLDYKIAPNELEDHHEARRNVSEQLSTKLHEIIQASETPLFGQDIYVAIMYTFMSELLQHRVHQLLSAEEKAMEKQDDKK